MIAIQRRSNVYIIYTDPSAWRYTISCSSS
jgi:hypothetical protein